MTETDGPTAGQWGGPPELSAWEALMWRADGDPRTRSTGVLLERLTGEPDWDRLSAAMTRLVTRLPRLRDRIVEPPLPLVAPRWSPDPHFDLGYHLRRVRLPGDGSERELFAHIGADMAHPIDRHRPPWEATLITGLADGSAALAFKVHHCLSDGLGLVQLLALAHDGGGSGSGVVALPDDGSATPTRVLTDGLRAGLSHAPGTLAEVAGGAAHVVRAGVADPVGSGKRVLSYVSSLGRMLTPPPVPRTLHSGGVGYAAITHDVSLADLRAAGKAAGGSVNDAFLAAVLGAFRRFHALSGPVPESLPLAFPISTRAPGDPEGGNRFSGVRFAAPLAEPDPVARIERIRAFVRSVRTEPALEFLGVIAPAMGLLPGAALTELSATLTATTDVQASNIPGVDHAVELAGVPVTGVYPLGPRPGIAAMVTMLTYDGTGCLGVTLDPEVVPDTEVFATCLREGFDEVLRCASRS
jgi:diacylglycerol O-acyltransferase / wax synthase